jgi:hypothetical protein
MKKMDLRRREEKIPIKLREKLVQMMTMFINPPRNRE